MHVLLLTLFLHGRGHHYGHHKHQPPCSVAFHLGCASLNPPPSGPFVGPPPFPGIGGQ